jgi:hypothetical protein
MKKNGIVSMVATAIILAVVGCGGTTQQKPIDPSGNWKLTFTDSNNNTFLLSTLFSQTGSVVSGVNISEVGNRSSFQCVAQPDATFSNGSVQNVSQFTGQFGGNFGTIAFTTTLNDAGSQATGTYTVTPGSGGNCLGAATTGNMVANEVPSVSGAWSGTVNCVSSCPAGSTSGTITLMLTQDDTTGKVTGTYTVTGLPGFTNGTIASGQSDLLSGASWTDTLTDSNGAVTRITGGPLNSFGTAGLGLDRSFNGNITTGSSTSAFYAITMTH